MARLKRKFLVVLRGFTLISLSNITLLTFTVIDDTTKEIVYRDYVDISVAVATPKVRRMAAWWPSGA